MIHLIFMRIWTIKKYSAKNKLNFHFRYVSLLPFPHFYHQYQEGGFMWVVIGAKSSTTLSLLFFYIEVALSRNHNVLTFFTFFIRNLFSPAEKVKHYFITVLFFTKRWRRECHLFRAQFTTFLSVHSSLQQTRLFPFFIDARTLLPPIKAVAIIGQPRKSWRVQPLSLFYFRYRTLVGESERGGRRRTR